MKAGNMFHLIGSHHQMKTLKGIILHKDYHASSLFSEEIRLHCSSGFTTWIDVTKV